MGKSSIERSHSKISNFKLTILALLAIISFNAIFVGLALYNYNQIISLACVIAAGAVSIILFILIRAFVR